MQIQKCYVTLANLPVYFSQYINKRIENERDSLTGSTHVIDALNTPKFNVYDG